MITNQEYERRKFGHLPAIHEWLGDLKAGRRQMGKADSGAGLISTDETAIQRTENILEVAQLVRELGPSFLREADPVKRRALAEDLRNVCDDLGWIRGICERRQIIIDELREKLMRPRKSESP